MHRLLPAISLTALFIFSSLSPLRAQEAHGYDPFADEYEAMAYAVPEDITGEVDLSDLSGGVGIQGYYGGGPVWRVSVVPNGPMNGFEWRRAASWAYVAQKRNPR